MPRLLTSGLTGSDVNELQAGLNFHIRSPATPLKPDGIFGTKTLARVKEFQRLAGIKDDGLVGPRTIAKIYNTLSGVVEARLTPLNNNPPVASRRSLFGNGTLISDAPTDPDVIRPQTRTASSQGFDSETKFVFNPLAKPSEGDHPLQLTITTTIPWPVKLPEPLRLEIEQGIGGKFQLDGKLKIPYKLVDSDRFELKPYFFVGAGVEQDGFKDINIGLGSRAVLRLFRDIGGTGVSVGLEADGGVKYKHDVDKDESKAKFFFDTTVVLTVPLF